MTLACTEAKKIVENVKKEPATTKRVELLKTLRKLDSHRAKLLDAMESINSN